MIFFLRIELIKFRVLYGDRGRVSLSFKGLASLYSYGWKRPNFGDERVFGAFDWCVFSE